MANFVQIPDKGLGYYLGRKAHERVWGQPFLILFLIELGERWFALHPKHPFGIGDIANKDGSPLPDHVSHNHGSAVDLFVIHQNGLQRNDLSNIVTWNDEGYDPDRTLQFVKLIKEFSSRYGMIQILYNDVYVQKEANDLGGYPPITYKDKHDEHIHITFNGKVPYSQKQIAEILDRKTRDSFSKRCVLLHS